MNADNLSISSSESKTSSGSKTSTESNNKNYSDAKCIKFTTKEMYYYRSIDKFYKNLDDDKIELMVDIVEGNSEISLRLMDWLVTKYADQIMVVIEQNNNDKLNVHIGYKAQLKSYKKKYFDPFRRLTKFYYIFNDSLKLLTTLGQLNFFKWAFKYNILDYIQKNFEVLSSAMMTSNREDKLQKNNIVKKKHKDNKQDLTVTATKIPTPLDSNECKIVVSFF